MFDSSELRDELQALKSDVSRLLNTTSEGIFDASTAPRRSQIGSRQH
jgi:hypothetical protein